LCPALRYFEFLYIGSSLLKIDQSCKGFHQTEYD